VYVPGLSNWASFIHKSSLRADSLLARLSDKDFERGMDRLRAHAAHIDPNQAVIEEIGWFVFMRQSRG
jgi:hypothetical protein